MKALFTSRNLIGDSLGISAALRAWHRDHPEYEIDLLTNNDHVAELYRGMGVPLNVIFEVEKFTVPMDGQDVPCTTEYDFEFTFNVNQAFAICDQEQVPMSVGYARLLKVDIGENQADIGPFYDPPIVEADQELIDSVPDDVILIAPFSASCASHDGKPPNKTLPWPKWAGIMRYLRTLGKPIRVTGSAKERADQLKLSEEEYLLGFPLRPLARVMREKTWLLVSVDNGISHLAGSQKIPHVLFYPMCLGLHYAVPWGNPKVIPIHIEPALVEPAQLPWTVKQAVQHLETLR